MELIHNRQSRIQVNTLLVINKTDQVSLESLNEQQMSSTLVTHITNNHEVIDILEDWETQDNLFADYAKPQRSPIHKKNN